MCWEKSGAVAERSATSIAFFHLVFVQAGQVHESVSFDHSQAIRRLSSNPTCGQLLTTRAVLILTTRALMVEGKGPLNANARAAFSTVEGALSHSRDDFRRPRVVLCSTTQKPLDLSTP